MNPGIFLIQDNGELVEMNEEKYESEKLLQTWLAKYPALLAGKQIDRSVPRRWLLVERECGVPSEEGGTGRWSIDHLFLDQDGIPTIVEVKRSTDTRIRREVVGQMLDYAANAVVYWPVSHMRERFAASCEDPEEKLIEFLEGDMEPEDFWQLADRNLQDRKIRLLFVADVIPTELQRIVEFLNDQMDSTEVLAIEIKQFVGKEQTGLVPRVIGQTAEAQQKKSTRTRTTTNEGVLDELSPEEQNVARKILNWSGDNFSVVNWRGASFVPVLEYGSEFSHNPITVYCRGKVPRVQIKFKRMKKRNGLSDETRLELVRRLNAIPGVNLPQDSIVRFPNIPLSTLASGDALEQFLSAIAWTIEEVKLVQQDGPNGQLSQSANL